MDMRKTTEKADTVTTSETADEASADGMTDTADTFSSPRGRVSPYSLSTPAVHAVVAGRNILVHQGVTALLHEILPSLKLAVLEPVGSIPVGCVGGLHAQ